MRPSEECGCCVQSSRNALRLRPRAHPGKWGDLMPHPTPSIEGGGVPRCAGGRSAHALPRRSWLTEANATVTAAAPHFYVGFATLRAATLFGAASCALHKGL